MKQIQLLQFKYNQHVNNMSDSITDIMNNYEFNNHNISKAKWEDCYKNSVDAHSVLLAVDKEYFSATECDYNNYIDWLINGNKTR